MPREWRASKPIKQLARNLRIRDTNAEARLWFAVRNSQLDGLKFRRQHPINRYITDFYCAEKRLIVELDGESHRYTGEADDERQQWLEANHYHVLRFTNDDVMRNLDGVIETIRVFIHERPDNGS